MAIKSGTCFKTTGVSRRDWQPRGTLAARPRKATVPGVSFNMTPTDVRIYGINDRNRMRSLRDYKSAPNVTSRDAWLACGCCLLHACSDSDLFVFILPP
jgi:hypothetical protein